MRKKELIKLLKQDMNEVMPDFGVMLERINSVKVEREKAAVPTTSTITRKKFKMPSREWEREERAPVRVEKRTRVMGLASFCLAIAMVGASMFSMGYFADTKIPPMVLASADTYVTVNINPAVDFTVNKNNKITSAIATNASGVVLMAKMTEALDAQSLVGYEINGAIIETVDMAAQMGYIDVEAEGLTNAMMISVIGKDEAGADEIKSGLAKETKKYFADNGIYAVVVTDYDSKDALVEEARKANPDLDENSSVSDLIASIEKENAGKSVIEAEIETARQDYEHYLSEQFCNSKNSLINCEVTKLNDRIKKTEKILVKLEEMLSALNNGGELADSIGAVDSDTLLNALITEYADKTAIYKNYKLQYDSEKERLETEISNNRSGVTESESKIAEDERQIADNNDYLSNSKLNLKTLTEEMASARELANLKLYESKQRYYKAQDLEIFNKYIFEQEKWQKHWNSCSCSACVAKTATLNRIMNEGIFYNIIAASDDMSNNYIIWTKSFKAETLRIMAEVLGVNEDKIGVDLVNEIVDYYIQYTLPYMNREVYLRSVEYMLSNDNAMRVHGYGQITVSTVNETLRYERDLATELQKSGEDLSAQADRLANSIAKIEAKSDELVAINKIKTQEIETLKADILIRNSAINEDTQKINDISKQFNVKYIDYGKFLKNAIEDLRNRLTELNVELNNVKAFKESYNIGDRLDGYDELNIALEALEAKFEADKAANDAEAVARNVEENIKANANRRYNDNVNKYTEHDRTFSEDEYAAWEAEQEKLISGIDWNQFYEQWLKENE